MRRGWIKGVQSRLQRVRKLRRSLLVCFDRESQTEEQNFVQISRFSCLAFSSPPSYTEETEESRGKRIPGFRERILMACALV